MAETLFQAAKTLMNEGKLEAACEKFALSQKLEPKPGTLLNLAVCNEKRGLIATAWAQFRSAATMARRLGHKSRTAFATERAKALESKVATVTLIASDPPQDLVVSVDGVRVDTAALGVALPIDPGRRKIEVSAPGKKPWSTEIDVPAAKAALSVSIPALEDLTPPTPAPVPGPPPVTGPAPVPVAPPSQDGADSVDGGPMWPLVIGGFSVAGVGLIVGAITGGMALGKGGEVKDACSDDACPASQAEALDDATLLANVSNVMFAIAGVGAVVGVVGFFVPTGGDDVEVGIGPGHVTFRGNF